MYGLGGIVPPDVTDGEKQPIQCFPLYSFLLALENPRVNLLVLDIEGAEYEVSKIIKCRYHNKFPDNFQNEHLWTFSETGSICSND